MDTPLITEETADLITEENLYNKDPLSNNLRNKKNLNINSYNTISFNTTNVNTMTSKNKPTKSIFDSKMYTTSSFKHTYSKAFFSHKYESSNTLQNSITSWTIPKSDRFKYIYVKPLNDTIYNTTSDTFASKYTTQGFGKRSEIVLPQSKVSPPPNRYKISSDVEKNIKDRKGFSLTYKPKHIPSDSEKNVPGPGNYSLRDFGQTKRTGVSIKSRLNFFYDDDVKQKEHCISPQSYLPNTKLTENLRFTKVNFGIGGRSPNENISVRNFPGPGTYSLPSVFDKKRKYKVPLN